MAYLYFFNASWCKDCTTTKKLLDDRGIDYILVDIDTAYDPFLKAHDIEVIPTLEVIDELDEVLLRIVDVPSENDLSNIRKVLEK